MRESTGIPRRGANQRAAAVGMQLTYTSAQFGRLALVAAGNGEPQGNGGKPRGRPDVHGQFRNASGSRHTYPSPVYLSENTSDLLAEMQSRRKRIYYFFLYLILYGYYVQ